MPVIMFMIVGLRLPDGPTIATMSPSAIVRSTPRSAGNSTLPGRYTFSTPASSIKGGRTVFARGSRPVNTSATLLTPSIAIGCHAPSCVPAIGTSGQTP